MQLKITSLVLFGLAFGLSQATAAADKNMTGEQITNLLSGNTAYGKHPKKGFTSIVYFGPDSTYAGNRSDGKKAGGTWHAHDNMHCITPNNEAERCRKVTDEGNGSYKKWKQPNNVMRGLIHVFTFEKIVQGNPENLK